MSELINYYNYLPKNLKPTKVKNLGYKKHHVDFPCRILVSGKSNSGKTLAILNFLHLCGPQFDKLTIITKKVEPLYEMMKQNNPESCDIIELANDGAEFPKIESFNGNIQHFVVFDDLVNSSYMKNCKEFFLRARKVKPYALNQCFITQDYFKTDSMLRKNMTDIWIFKPASMNEQRNIERDFPILKQIPQIWTALNKKTPDAVNKFININIDSETVRVNFGQQVA